MSTKFNNIKWKTINSLRFISIFVRIQYTFNLRQWLGPVRLFSFLFMVMTTGLPWLYSYEGKKLYCYWHYFYYGHWFLWVMCGRYILPNLCRLNILFSTIFVTIEKTKDRRKSCAKYCHLLWWFGSFLQSWIVHQLF